jgi:hypothetical protein
VEAERSIATAPLAHAAIDTGHAVIFYGAHLVAADDRPAVHQNKDGSFDIHVHVAAGPAAIHILSCFLEAVGPRSDGVSLISSEWLGS